MAKRIEQIMAEGEVEVSHKGEEVTLDLPEWFTASESFFTEQALLDHCINHGILLATLQKGFEQHLIDLRAKARPQAIRPEKGADPVDQSIVKDKDGAQQRILAHKPEPRTPAGDPTDKTANALAGMSRAQQRIALEKAGFSKAQIDAMMNAE